MKTVNKQLTIFDDGVKDPKPSTMETLKNFRNYQKEFSLDYQKKLKQRNENKS